MPEFDTTRRTLMAGLAASAVFDALPGHSAPRRAMPKGFLWGAAISAHQSGIGGVPKQSFKLQRTAHSALSRSLAANGLTLAASLTRMAV